MNPTWQQSKILEAIREPGAKVSVRSGHGVGKSGASAGAILWFIETRDYPRIPCTAPTAHQLKDVLWAELAKWMRHSDRISARLGIHPAFWITSMFQITNERLYDKSAKGEWFAVARTSSRDNPDALQGFHASDLIVSPDGTGVIEQEKEDGNLLFIVDEASGVIDEVYTVAEGALSSKGSRLLMLGNPTRNTGYFADSHKKNRGEFTTLHFRTSDSPLADPEYRAKLVRKWGEGSNIVRVRADGEFPKQDDDVLIPLDVAEASLTREPANQPIYDIRLGIDVARFGDDRTVFTVRRGRDLLHISVTSKESTMQTVGRAIKIGEQYGVTGYYPDTTNMQGVADRLREMGKPVVEVNFAAGAPRRKGTGENDEVMQGKTMRDYLWLEGADWFKTVEPSLALVEERQHAEDLVGEACSVRYRYHSSGVIRVESKDELKSPKRLGFSPDLIDSLICTFHPGKAGTSRYATAGSRTF